MWKLNRKKVILSSWKKLLSLPQMTKWSYVQHLIRKYYLNFNPFSYIHEWNLAEPIIICTNISILLSRFRAWWPPQTADKAWSASQPQAFYHACRGQWHYQSTQPCKNNLAQVSLRYHSRAVIFCWAKAKQKHISNNMQSTCPAQLSHGHQSNGPCFSWPRHHKWVALSGSLVPQRTSLTTWPCTNISPLSH